MDNPFSYPSLAFGAEAMQIGKELGRYNSFKNETTTPNTNEKDTDPAVPTETTDTPPKGGQDLSGKWTPLEIVTGVSMFALLILLAKSYDGDSFDILPNLQF
mgnify:FL=1|jgi:hypothetical protein|tara:strand:+ start:164 stop:469 length:306 start_codon:yes stop_codon:yes gene_type:complete